MRLFECTKGCLIKSNQSTGSGDRDVAVCQKDSEWSHSPPLCAATTTSSHHGDCHHLTRLHVKRSSTTRYARLRVRRLLLRAVLRACMCLVVLRAVLLSVLSQCSVPCSSVLRALPCCDALSRHGNARRPFTDSVYCGGDTMHNAHPRTSTRPHRGHVPQLMGTACSTRFGYELRQSSV